jgi:S1-C subfamily serine protease
VRGAPLARNGGAQAEAPARSAATLLSVRSVWRRVLRRVVLLGLIGPGAGLTACASQTVVNGVRVAHAPAVGQMPEQRLAQRTAAAVGVLETDVGRGMAFVIDPEGYVVTNRHVVEDADHIERLRLPALDPPLEFTRVHVVYIDPTHDLALLQVEVDDPLPALPLATKKGGPALDRLATDDRVMLLSRAADEVAGLAAHSGTVASLGTMNEAVGPGPYVGLSQNVRRGQSGGPVVDRYGRAVGVVTWTWKYSGGGFAIPIGRVNDLLRDRPALDAPDQLEARATQRVSELFAALAAGELERARRTVAPTYARELRDRTLGRMFTELDDRDVVVEFTHTLDGLEGEDAFAQLAARAAKMGSPEARRALRIDPHVSGATLVTFFMEVGQAYVAARTFGGQNRDDALGTVGKRVMSLDAARSFVLSDLLHDFHGGMIELEHMELVPGLGAPRAVATLVARSDGRNVRAGDRLSAQLRLEWGDWYVAQVHAVGTAETLTRVEVSPPTSRPAAW